MKKYAYVTTVYEDTDCDSIMFSKDYSPATFHNNCGIIWEDVIYFDTVEEFKDELKNSYMEYEDEETSEKLASSKVEEMIHPVYVGRGIEVRPKVLDFE